jgi:hypothetical protein
MWTSKLGGLPKKGEEAKEKDESVEYHFGAIKDDDFAKLSCKADRLKHDIEAHIKTMEFTVKLLLLAQTRGARCLYASIAIGMIKDALDIDELVT